jgi:hypothetical protein
MKFHIKLTPLVLFLCILAVLVLSIIFGNALKSAFTQQPPKETFTNFNNPNNTANFGGTAYIPQYSADPNHVVINLYDGIYFDKANGNLIEVSGDACSRGSAPKGNVDCGGTASTPASIRTVHVTPRSFANSNAYDTQKYTDGSVKPYDTYESKATSIDYSISNFTYTTKNPLTDTYQVFYFSANQYTFVHIMNVDSTAAPTKGKNVISYVLDTTGILGQPVTYADTGVNVPNYTNAPTSTANLPTATTSLVTPEHSYISQAPVTKLSNLVKYDIKNGYLLFDVAGANGQASYAVYDREDWSRGVISNPAQKLGGIASAQTLKSAILNDGNNCMVLVMSYMKMTLISFIASTTAHNYTIKQTYVFDESGQLSVGSPTTAAPTNAPGATNAPTLPPGAGSGGFSGGQNPCGDEVSCKWYWYFNTMGMGNTMGAGGFLSNDYILKTQVVPPVCPSCPMCNGGKSGVCTNCGGQGGSGTADVSGSAVKSTTTTTSGSDGRGSGSDRNPSNVGEFLEDTGSGVKNFAKDAAGGAVGLAKETVGGAVGLTKETVGGAVGLAKDTVGGAVGLLRDFGKGVAGLGGTVGVDGSAAGGDLSGLRSVSGSTLGKGGAAPIDNYSYYGALSSKGGNFVPVTADFSKFGR